MCRRDGLAEETDSGTEAECVVCQGVWRDEELVAASQRADAALP